MGKPFNCPSSEMHMAISQKVCVQCVMANIRSVISGVGEDHSPSLVHLLQAVIHYLSLRLGSLLVC
jgi:hypothetical protein